MTSSKINVEKMQQVMFKKQNIRNISVIAHVDHGKSTLTDALVCRAGLISENHSGEKLFTHSTPDEIDRGITIKSTAVSMYFEMNNDKILGSLPRDGNGFLVNLIDSPGHVDFSSEVTAALRVTDGALVVVDVISGVSCQTETVLRQALSECIKPVLIINKIDRAILEQKLEPEKLYLRLKQIIEQVNYFIGIYSSVKQEDESQDSEPDENRHGFSRKDQFECSLLDPTKGNVAFAAGKDGWAFTLSQFAEIYNKKRKNSSTSLINKLWDDNFYDSTKNKWQQYVEAQDGTKLKRGFVQYVLEPIYKVLGICMENNFDELEKFNEKLDIDFKLKQAEKETMQGKDLMKRFMKRWLPAADAMLELILVHLPSPLIAQRYRVRNLYEGPLDDEAAIAIRECDSNGHLMIYISKMIPDPVDKSKFFAFGRVFSGTAEAGMKVRILGPEYKTGSDSGLVVKNLTRCACMVGSQPISFDQVPCGNIIALSGIDKFLLKSGTITTYEMAHTIKSMKFSVSPVVRVAVDPVNPGDLAKFIEGLKRLCRSDQLIQCDLDKGQHILAGAGELHLEICLRDLENIYAKVPIKVSEPLVTYKETVIEQSSQVCLAKTANKLNRIFMSAEPLSEEFCHDIDNKKITLNQDTKERAKYLHSVHNFDLNDAKKIWCFGPNQFDANLLVDMTKGVPSSGDVTDTICAGFQWATDEGILCQESLRGVRFNLVDLVYHSDPAHRKGAQLIPAVRRSIMASMLTAQPRLLEPIYLVDIQCPDNCVGPVYTLLNKKRGNIIDDQRLEGTLLQNIKAYLPVNESNGFTGELREVTGGKAFQQCSFDHWQLLPGDPFDLESKAGQICQQIRKVKNLREQMPQLADYLDKI